MSSGIVLVPAPGQSAFVAVDGTNKTFSAMAVGEFYLLTVVAAAYVTQGPSASSPAASGAAGSCLVNPSAPLLLHGSNGDTLAITQVAAPGGATLQKMVRMVG